MTETSYLNATPNALTLVRGTSKTIELTVLDGVGAAFNLTNATLWFTVKKFITDEIFVIQKRSTDATEIEVTSAREGKASIYLLPSDTFNLSVREYTFDIWVVIPPPLGAQYLVVGPSTLELQDSVTRIQ
jgi:hypothetical protein